MVVDGQSSAPLILFIEECQSMGTTGNFTSEILLNHEASTRLPDFSLDFARSIGTYAAERAAAHKYPISIAIQIGDWQVFKTALEGASSEHDGWITRKARVVNLTGHSTMYERVKAEEEGLDWHSLHSVADETHAIHGGGFPLVTEDGVLRGVLLISGLPQVDDHNFAVEVMTAYLKGL